MLSSWSRLPSLPLLAKPSIAVNRSFSARVASSCVTASPPPCNSRFARAKKRAPARSCTCGQTCRHKGADCRQVMTSVGLISLFRVYFFCLCCRLGSYPLDDVLGLDGFLSKATRRVVCFIAANNSFAWTEAILGEACGWSISDELIRQVCYREGERIEQWLDADEQVYQQFITAAGHIEVEIDAATVNTVDGWRDMKICIFAKREPGEAATPEQWDKRKLPAPTSRMAFAKIEEAEQFRKRTGDWMERLAVVDTSEVSVLGDGAEWIWNLAKENFPFAFEVLDIYHVIEHLGTTAKKLHGEGSDEAKQWQEQTRHKILQDGWWGLCEHSWPDADRAGGKDARAAGGTAGLLQQAHQSDELLRTAVRGTDDWQRHGGRGGEEPDRQEAEAEQGAMASGERAEDGGAVLRSLQ